MYEINPTRLEENAYELELHIASSRLFRHVFRNGEGINVEPGRYRFLEKAINETPQLLETLLNGHGDSVNRGWSEILKKHQTDAHFLHALAVMYREQAVASHVGGQPNSELWIISTALWALLLSTDEFWDYFCEHRFTPRNCTERVALEPEQQEELLKESVNNILAVHSRHGSTFFASGRHEQARVHLLCLDLCRTGEGALKKKLHEYNMPYQLTPDSSRLKHIEDFAEELLDNWCVNLVREADKAVEDAEAIKNLPKGIRKNYEGGVRHLEPFINLNIPVIRFLRSSLAWYNDWCYDLYVTGEIEQIKALMKPACVVADQLIPLCTQGIGHRPEHQALSQHFLLRGFTDDDPEHAVKEYEEALKWNPANDNAQTLLGDAKEKIYMEQLDTAIECADREKFNEAYEVLDALEKHVEDKKKVRGARAVVCFKHANSLANDGSFREALKRACEAQQLEPRQPVIEKFVDEMKELAPEEDNLRNLGNAHKEFEKEHYSKAITLASKVERQSRFRGQAQQLQSAAYFHRGIEALKKETPDFTRAEADLENSSALNDNKEENKVIANQLEIVKQNRIGYELKQAFDQEDWPKAEKILRKHLKTQNSRAIKQQLQSQLSFVLNQQAVGLINKAQEIEKEFGEAIQDILSRVKREQGVL